MCILVFLPVQTPQNKKEQGIRQTSHRRGDVMTRWTNHRPGGSSVTRRTSLRPGGSVVTQQINPHPGGAVVTHQIRPRPGGAAVAHQIYHLKGIILTQAKIIPEARMEADRNATLTSPQPIKGGKLPLTCHHPRRRRVILMPAHCCLRNGSCPLGV